MRLMYLGKRYLIAIFLFILMCVSSILFAIHESEFVSQRPAWIYPDFTSCEKNAFDDMPEGRTNLYFHYDIASLCYLKLYDQNRLTISEVNRTKYVEQNAEDRIMLWMVVAITISGVLLSGLQLLGSFNLAMAGKSEFAQDSNLILEKNRLSIKSSVTGLLILLVSLVFFIIYVKFVYKIDNEASGTISGAETPSTWIKPSQPILGGGTKANRGTMSEKAGQSEPSNTSRSGLTTSDQSSPALAIKP